MVTGTEMTIKDKSPAPAPAVNRFPFIMMVYCRSLSVVMILLGLYQWAIIVGLFDGTAGSFEDIQAALKIATMYLAVVDLVAAVGLWLLASWGNVIWIAAALSEVVLHIVFRDLIGIDLPLVVFHLATVLAFVVLSILARRAAADEEDTRSPFGT